ncbi:MAG: oxaloacetate decarboxylase [Chlorobi bacterium]|nr:oxaloacetate decarboxylase [Chlorobiota bacterium]
MSEAYSTAITLLFVGMFTVFTILASVVLMGKFIIFIINKFFPGELNPTIKPIASNVLINKKTLSAIVAAVEIVTKGKGRITEIKKNNDK